MKRQETIVQIKKIAIWIPLIIFLTWTLLPLIWSLSASFKPALELYKKPPSLIPRDFTWNSYIGVFTFQNFWVFLMNSFILAIGSTLITILVSSLAGYAFARYMFPLRNLLLMMVLIPRILPRSALVVPLYRLFAAIGILDTYLVLLLTYTATAVPMCAWILAGFFKGIPPSLEESAKLDGAGFFTVLYRIILPVALPGLISVIIVAGVQSWNEFPFVLAFTSSAALRTLPYQLFLMQDTMGIQDWSLINAFSIVTILPILIIFIVFQKRVINGIIGGAVK
jgi:ABC-type glycerol-3-phosphate transport system permease component